MKKTNMLKISSLLLTTLLVCVSLAGCGKADILDELREANAVDAQLEVCDNFTLSTHMSEAYGSYVYTADAFFGRDDIALHEENNFGMGYYYSCAYRGGEAFETDDEVLGYKQYLFIDDGDYAAMYDKAVAEWTADFLPLDGEMLVSDVTENGKRVITTAATLAEPSSWDTELTQIEATYTVDENSLLIESKELVYKDADGNAVLTYLIKAGRNSHESTLFDELKANVTDGDESRTVTVVKAPSGDTVSLAVKSGRDVVFFAQGRDAVYADFLYTDEACTEVYGGGAYVYDDLTLYYSEK